MSTTLATSRIPSVNTYSYLWTTRADHAVSELAGAGYRRFELMVQPPHLGLDLSGSDVAALKAMAAAGEIGIDTLNMPSLDTNLTSAVPEMRAYSVDILSRTIALAAHLGVPGVVVVPGRINPLFPAPAADLRGWLNASLDQLVPVAREHGVRLLIENVPFTCIPKAEDILALVTERADQPLGICYDVANGWFAGEEPGDGLKLLAHRLDVVHASDTTRRVWRHDALGEGDIDFAAAVEALDAIGWAGPFILEIIGADPLGALAQSVDVLRSTGRTFSLGDA